MKMVTIVFLLFVLFLTVIFTAEEENDNHVIEFNKFKRRFKKKYNGTSPCAYYKRWKRRKQMIKRHNRAAARGRSSFRLIDNQFADESEEEWEKKLFGVTVPGELLSIKRVGIQELSLDDKESGVDNRQTLPYSLDLRNNPCMPPVKTQSSCGGCWAFIATTSVEYQTCNKNLNKTTLLLSEQQLIDCSDKYGTKGCNGGFYVHGWNYLIAIGGQTSNTTYPFRAVAGRCQFNKGITPVIGKLSKYHYLISNERAIMAALLRGPVAVSIVANSKFILYSSGIFDDDTCKNGTINHGAVLVGYGRANGTDYWIVRNSWGSSWGQNGHIFMKRHVNMCRLAEYAFLAEY